MSLVSFRRGATTLCLWISSLLVITTVKAGPVPCLEVIQNLFKNSSSAQKQEDSLKRVWERFFGHDQADWEFLRGAATGPKSTKAAKKFKLTVPEVMAIRAYSSGDYELLNRILRKQEPKISSEEITSYLEILDSALKKLPVYDHIVYRTVDLPDAVLTRYKVGRIIREDGYLSTTKHPHELMNMGRRKINFLIHSKSGRLIEDVATLKYEGEVLFPPGTQFEVIKRTDGPDETVMELQEVHQ